jgi:hypothetical protein
MTLTQNQLAINKQRAKALVKLEKLIERKYETEWSNGEPTILEQCSHFHGRMRSAKLSMTPLFTQKSGWS